MIDEVLRWVLTGWLAAGVLVLPTGLWLLRFMWMLQKKGVMETKRFRYTCERKGDGK